MTAWTCWRDETHQVGTHPMLGWPQCQECGAAPAYHERGDYLPDGFLLNIYVPVDPKWSSLAPRSAIVGLPELNWTLVYYEGWINGRMQYGDREARDLRVPAGRDTWEAGLLHAADRMVTEYPTVARMTCPTEQLRRIGTYNPRTHEVVVEDEEALTAWIA